MEWAFLALGKLAHEQLAEKYDRVAQAITNFSSRNKDEIRRARQVQSDEYQGLGYAEKWERLAFREQLLLDIEERLKDPDLSILKQSIFGYGGQTAAFHRRGAGPALCPFPA
jgi:hypothetical protein